MTRSMKFLSAATLMVASTTFAFQGAPRKLHPATHLQDGVIGNSEAMDPSGDAPPPITTSRSEFFRALSLAPLASGMTVLGINVFNGGFAENPTEFIAETGTKPGLTDPKLDTLTSEEVAGLFGQWNNALLTGDPDTVARRYAKGAVLLPTKSDIPRTDYDGIRDYFVKFLEKEPKGTIIESFVQTQPNYAMDVGIYEFEFNDGCQVRARYSFVYTKEDGCWKIKHHHSSAMPEIKAVEIMQNV